MVQHPRLCGFLPGNFFCIDEILGLYLFSPCIVVSIRRQRFAVVCENFDLIIEVPVRFFRR